MVKTAGFVLFAILVLFPSSHANALPAGSALADYGDYNCVTCHLDMDDETLTPPVNEWAESVHREAGIACADCHGGNPKNEDMAMDPAAGFVGAPKRMDVPALCAKCHSDAKLMRKYNKRADQYDLYKGSVHGRKLAKGDTGAPNCVSCHGKHKILRVKDPKSTVNRKNISETCGGCHSKKKIFEPRHMPYDQLAKYKKSYHYNLLGKGDLLVPTCVDCHSNHAVMPTRNERVQTVCFNCHTKEADNYKQSPHYKAWKEDGEPICLTCHNQHDILRPTIAKFSGDNDNDCIECHEDDSKAFMVGQDIETVLSATMGAVDSAKSSLFHLEENGRGGFETTSLVRKLDKVDEKLANLHALTHSLNITKIKKGTDEIMAVTSHTNEVVKGFWHEIKTRKMGLVIAWIVFLGLVFTLLKWSSLVDAGRRNEDK